MPKSKRARRVVRKSKRKSLKKQISPQKQMNTENVMARCMKCRKQMKMNDAKMVTLKNGRTAMKGICAICGTKMFKFV